MSILRPLRNRAFAAALASSAALLPIAADAQTVGTTARAVPSVVETTTTITADQCRTISAIGVEVARALGPSTLSDDFKRSFRAFLGQNLACDGPREIYVPTGRDADAYNTMRSLLGSGPTPIRLEQMGVRAIVGRRAAALTQ